MFSSSELEFIDNQWRYNDKVYSGMVMDYYPDGTLSAMGSINDGLEEGAIPKGVLDSLVTGMQSKRLRQKPSRTNVGGRVVNFCTVRDACMRLEE